MGLYNATCRRTGTDREFHVGTRFKRHCTKCIDHFHHFNSRISFLHLVRCPWPKNMTCSFCWGQEDYPRTWLLRTSSFFPCTLANTKYGLLSAVPLISWITLNCWNVFKRDKFIIAWAWMNWCSVIISLHRLLLHWQNPEVEIRGKFWRGITPNIYSNNMVLRL